MPSITEVVPSSADRGLQFNVEPVGGQVKAGAVKGNGSSQILTVERKTEGGQSQFLAQITFDHSPAKPMPMSIDDMMLQLANLSASLQGETVKIAEGMINHNRDTIRQNSEDRVKMFDKLQKMERKMEKQQKNAELWGWVGTTAGVLVTFASMGSMGPLAAACMAAGTTIGLGNQIATSAGLYESLSKKDPTAAQVLNYSMFALQIAFSLAGTVAAANSAKTVAEGGAELASQGAKAGGNAAKVARESAEAAAQTGSSMSGASSSSQMADDLVKGISDVARSANKGQQFTDEALDAGQAAGQGAAKQISGSGKNAVDGASDSAVDNANIAKNLKDAQFIEKMEKTEQALSRTGYTLQIAAAVGKTEQDVETAILGHDATDSRAKLVKIQKNLTLQQSLMNEITEALAQMYGELQNAAKAPSEMLSKLNTGRMSVISNIGTNTAHTA